MNHSLGALESRFSPTYRHNYHSADSVYAAVETEDLPKKVDLRELYGEKVPVRDQKTDGACVAFAVNVVAQQLELQDTSKLKGNLAPRFTYVLRENKNTEGMFISNAMEIVQNYGVVREKIVPYDNQNIQKAEDLPKKAFDEGNEHKMGVAARIWTLDALKKSIAQRNAGAVIAFKVYNFSNYFWRKEYPNQEPQGGHCVAVVGYEDDPNSKAEGHFIIQNSWGENWGERGYTYYSYEEFRNNHHFEVWTFVDIKGSKPFEPEAIEPIRRGQCAML